MSSPRRILFRRSLTTLGVAFTSSAAVLGFATPASAITQTKATAQLRTAGIPWTSTGDCSDRNHPSCTSFEGIRQATITGIITFKRASGCAITITGGTETGHPGSSYTHSGGYKVDIRLSVCVQNYISARYTYLGHVSGFGHQYRSPAGNIYTRERTHWDILYYTCGC
ncbi:hypothetical protein GCM10027290_13720 [Micromonospora sonneratiae]|jgi:hypothetical protein|uniref:Uncharacterized protein n=1 Tax=Micromonospora sonneratiae TaxID=1184706 RepID=A0ABW3YNE9_9ACTN